MLDIVKNGFECIEAPRGENHLGECFEKKFNIDNHK